MFLYGKARLNYLHAYQNRITVALCSESTGKLNLLPSGTSVAAFDAIFATRVYKYTGNMRLKVAQLGRAVVLWSTPGWCRGAVWPVG